jgi:hypothetical protein
MSLACCHTSAPQMYYSCGCVASSAHHLFRLCSHGYLLQNSEEACQQARSRTDVGALMESVRLQRKQLLLWDDALHSLQVLSPAGPFFLLRLFLFVLRPFPSSPEATLFTRLLLSCRCSGTRRNVLRTAAARCRRRCTRLFQLSLPIASSGCFHRLRRLLSLICNNCALPPPQRDFVLHGRQLPSLKGCKKLPFNNMGSPKVHYHLLSLSIQSSK